MSKLFHDFALFLEYMCDNNILPDISRADLLEAEVEVEVAIIRPCPVGHKTKMANNPNIFNITPVFVNSEIHHAI